MISILSIFQTDPISIATRQLRESRVAALNSARLALCHKAEADCQRIYSEMYVKHTQHLLSQLADWEVDKATVGE